MNVLTSFPSQGDQLQNNLDKMEAGAGKVPCRGARVNIGDMDEMVRSFYFNFIMIGSCLM